jgi:hypothetical protein
MVKENRKHGSRLVSQLVDLCMFMSLGDQNELTHIQTCFYGILARICVDSHKLELDRFGLHEFSPICGDTYCICRGWIVRILNTEWNFSY